MYIGIWMNEWMNEQRKLSLCGGKYRMKMRKNRKISKEIIPPLCFHFLVPQPQPKSTSTCWNTTYTLGSCDSDSIPESTKVHDFVFAMEKLWVLIYFWLWSDSVCVHNTSMKPIHHRSCGEQMRDYFRFSAAIPIASSSEWSPPDYRTSRIICRIWWFRHEHK